MKFFKKKNDIITSPANGNVISMDRVLDEVFSNKLLGDGFAVEPSDGTVYSPVVGKVFSIFPTKHAISIVTNNGLEVLVHMGLDTVELEGKGFEVLVEKDQKITHDTKIANMNLDYIVQNEKLTTIIVAFTNLKDKEILVIQGEQTAKAEIATIEI